MTTEYIFFRLSRSRLLTFRMKVFVPMLLIFDLVFTSPSTNALKLHFWKNIYTCLHICLHLSQAGYRFLINHVEFRRSTLNLYTMHKRFVSRVKTGYFFICQNRGLRVKREPCPYCKDVLFNVNKS